MQFYDLNIVLRSSCSFHMFKLLFPFLLSFGTSSINECTRTSNMLVTSESFVDVTFTRNTCAYCIISHFACVLHLHYKCCVALTRGAMGFSAVCDCGIS